LLQWRESTHACHLSPWLAFQKPAGEALIHQIQSECSMWESPYPSWDDLGPLIQIQLLTGEQWVSRFLPLTCAVVPYRFGTIGLTLCTYAPIQSCAHQTLRPFQKYKARFDSVKSLRPYFDN
jgi:hypothetical protein